MAANAFRTLNLIFFLLIAKNTLDLMDFLLKHCFCEIIYLTFLGLDCSHFNQSLSWLTFLLGFKKKKEGGKKSWELFEISPPTLVEKGKQRSCGSPWKPQLRYITGPVTVQHTDTHCVRKHTRTAAAEDRGGWCLWTLTETQSLKSL